METTLWIVGQWVEDGPWGFGGVFDSKERAVAACRDDTYFIAPYTLNEAASHETTPMIGAYYPLFVQQVLANQAPDPCAHDDWKITGGAPDMNPPCAIVTCGTCGTTQQVDELWLVSHPEVIAAARRDRLDRRPPMVRKVDEVL